MIPATLEERRREVGRIVWSILHDQYAPNVDYPDTINAGGCEGFAKQARQDVAGAGYVADVEWRYDDPSHCWVRVKETGLVYDSEAPYGVPEPRHLPFFMRAEVVPHAA